MNLDDAQKQKVTAWINEGLKLSEIQKRLGTDMGLNLTYMEVRFLVDDLKLIPKDPEPPKPAEPPAPAGPPAPPAAAPGRVTLSVDQLARPGAMVSGSVTFRDGKQAAWYLDQTGRLGVVPKEQGYKPTAADVQEFQMALESELSRLGM